MDQGSSNLANTGLRAGREKDWMGQGNRDHVCLSNAGIRDWQEGGLVGQRIM
jgi:hypothetical protein